MKRWQRVAALSLLCLFGIESVRGAIGDSQTSDESVTIASGYAYLCTGRVIINPEHPMLAKSLIAAPLLALRPRLELDTDAWRTHRQWLAAHEFLWENRVPGRRLVFVARIPVIIAAMALLGLVFLAGCRLYGPGGGLLSLLVAAACPDLLAHGHLATLDVPLTLAATLALLSLLHFAERPSRSRHFLLAVALGLMLATKISSVQVLPALTMAAVVRAMRDPDLATRGSVSPPRFLRLRARASALYVLLGGLVSATVYGLPVLAATYLGPPWLFLEQGLLRNALLAGLGHPSYLLGETTTRGFVSYYAVAIGVKWPVLTLLLLLVALMWWPSARRSVRSVELTLLAFALFFIVSASLAPAQTGIRYILPAYPALFIFVGRLATVQVRPRLAALAAATLVGSYLGVCASARAGYVSYFNELVAQPDGIRVLADSNLDWGQDLYRLRDYLDALGNPPIRLSYFGNAPPESAGITYQALPAAGPVLEPPARLLPASGVDLVAVSANNLLALFFDRDLYRWLRERDPIAVIGSIWLYDLAGDPDAHRELAGSYARAGTKWRRWAAHEWYEAERLAGQRLNGR